jgi:sugar phosphate isomerase/epimerase
VKLGVSTWAYGWAIGVPGYPPAKPMDILSFARRVAELGVGLVQIADNLPLHKLPPAKLDAFEAEVRRLGLSVELGTRGIDYELLDTYRDLCLRFESPILRTLTDLPGQERSLEDVIANLKSIIADFEQADITLAIENHSRFTTREFERLVQEVASPRIGICLDTVNSFGALEGPEVVVRTLAPYTVNLHVKEFSIRRADFVMGFVIEGQPVGQGRLNVPWLLDQFEGHGHDPNAILEQWPYPDADLEATIRKEDEWAVESVRYLRSLIPER